MEKPVRTTPDKDRREEKKVCKSETTNYQLQITNYKLQKTNCEPQTTTATTSNGKQQNSIRYLPLNERYRRGGIKKEGQQLTSDRDYPTPWC